MPARERTNEVDKILLYFSAMGVSLSGVRKLLLYRCETNIRKSQLNRQLQYLITSLRLQGRDLGGIDHEKLARHFQAVLPNEKKFERLIYFGEEEERLLDPVSVQRPWFLLQTNHMLRDHKDTDLADVNLRALWSPHKIVDTGYGWEAANLVYHYYYNVEACLDSRRV